MDNTQFGAFLEQAIRIAEAMLKTAETGGESPLPAVRLRKIVFLFQRLYNDMELNIGVGHMTGLILAELS